MSQLMGALTKEARVEGGILSKVRRSDLNRRKKNIILFWCNDDARYPRHPRARVFKQIRVSLSSITFHEPASLALGC